MGIRLGDFERDVESTVAYPNNHHTTPREVVILLARAAVHMRVPYATPGALEFVFPIELKAVKCAACYKQKHTFQSNPHKSKLYKIKAIPAALKGSKTAHLPPSPHQTRASLVVQPGPAEDFSVQPPPTFLCLAQHLLRQQSGCEVRQQRELLC